ncbi:MAG: YbjQ family protein [Oscillospiraceae bacterium]|nr:YbjQ family protein [Oscillospiraceae bacterium]
MILVTTDYISGKELEMLGIVKGSTVQSAHAGKDIGAAFKTLVGGELSSYNEMLNAARAMATKRMVKEAEEMGADAIVGVRYASAEIVQGAAEVIAYGTAVRFADSDGFI